MTANVSAGRGEAAGPPGTGERLRQGGAHRAGRGPAQARRGDRLHRLDGAADRGRGRAGHPGRGADRLPRVPRRPRQDPAPARARRAARRHPPRRAHGAARRARHRPVRAARREPLPVHRDGRLRRGARRVRRADRHRRARDGAREREEPRQRGRGRGPRALRVGARPGRGGRVHPRRPPSARRRRLPAHRHLRRRRRLLAGQRARPRRRRPVPGLGRGDLGAGRDAALRREPAPGCRALHRGPGWAGRRGAVARQGDVVQQLRRRRRRMARRPRPRRRADGRRDQAHQPVRDRDRRGRRRGAPQGARDGPGERVRRRDRDQPRGQRGDGRAGRRRVHRGGAGAVVRARGDLDPDPQEERAAAAPAGRRGPRGRRDAADLRWPAPAAARPDRRPGRRPGVVDAGHRRPRRGRRAGRSRVRLAGLPRGEVERDPAGVGWCGRRDRDGAGQPGRLRAPRGRAGRRPGPRMRWPPPTRSSRSRTGSRCCWRPGYGRSCSPAARCATTWWSRPPQRRAYPCT